MTFSGQVVNFALTLNEYQKRARATAIYPPESGLVYTTLGLSGEAGEVANNVKKMIRDDEGLLTKEREAKLVSELGDCLWYLAMAADEVGLTLEDVALGNLTKLSKRKDNNTLQDKNR